MFAFIKKTVFPALVCLLVLTTWRDCPAARHQTTITGRTMGTFYTVKFISRKKESVLVWKKRIDMQLRQVNRNMSMFDPKSELSEFNRLAPDTGFTASTNLYAILEQARELHGLTRGAWDGTVKPLVDLWGFGTRTQSTPVPDPEAIAQALAGTGFSNITFIPPRTIKKTKPVTLDLGSIAKGWGVDAVKRLLKGFKIEDCLVEIGGELSATGKNAKNQNWSVGINRPDIKSAGQELFRVVRLENQAIATSGNYRNFFIHEGRKYTHIIDPRTGYPVDGSIVSATVVNPSCTFADGLATALMVMSAEQGVALVNTLKDTECLIIEKKGDQFVPVESENFHRLYLRP